MRAHTNTHNCQRGSGREKLELLSDTRGESNPGKHERSRQTSPRRLSGSYFPVTLSHTGCLSPGRRGHDTSDNSQQPPPPSSDSLTGRTSMRVGPRSFFSLPWPRTWAPAPYLLSPPAESCCRSSQEQNHFPAPDSRLHLHLALVYHSPSLWFPGWKTGFKETCIVSKVEACCHNLHLLKLHLQTIHWPFNKVDQ